MKPRSLLAILGAVVLTLAVAIPAFAWPAALDGAPSITQDSPTGYYIWHESDNGFHLRTHGPHAAHDFVAHLHTDGTFENVDTVRLESRDGVRLEDGGHTLVYRVHTYDATDGVNFTVRGGESLRFNLELDGTQFATSHIYLGANGRHPSSNPFTIAR